ncbi:hypothetical protein NKI95_28575 [Mesorhizobium sp. M0306]|uniref:hypothetical protein n=1 Tax=Mesorhizobium sp. M0306 TaxID=2956932 RepID=UPI00333A455A
MKIEDAVTAVTSEPSTLMSCLGQPVVAYHVMEIMRETDLAHAREMQHALMRRSIEALGDDGWKASPPNISHPSSTAASA